MLLNFCFLNDVFRQSNFNFDRVSISFTFCILKNVLQSVKHISLRCVQEFCFVLLCLEIKPRASQCFNRDLPVGCSPGPPRILSSTFTFEFVERLDLSLSML